MVQTESPGEEKVFELFTRDISSEGAFFPVEAPLPAGEKVKISLSLSIPSLGRTGDPPRKAVITTKGRVIRSTPQGMAVAFEGRYSIAPAAVS